MSAAQGVRRARPSDAETCAAIKNEWIDETPWMPRMQAADDLVRHYRDTVFPKREVSVTGDPVTGFMMLDGAEVTSLFCSVRGQGLGHVLLAHAKGRRRRLEAWTFVANTGARRFYLREGFEEVARTDGENEERLPDVLYRWETRGA